VAPSGALRPREALRLLDLLAPLLGCGEAGARR